MNNFIVSQTSEAEATDLTPTTFLVWLSGSKQLVSYWLARARLEPIIKFRYKPDPEPPNPGQTHMTDQTNALSETLNLSYST